jgi:hypothetical protein
MKRREKDIAQTKASGLVKFKAEKEMMAIYEDDKEKIEEKFKKLREQKNDNAGQKLLEIQQKNGLLLIEDLQVRALAQIEIERTNELAGLKGVEINDKMKAAINQKYNLKKQAQNKATSDAERKLGIGDLGAVASILGGMASMQGEGTDAWKKTKIAEARINSFMAASSAYTSMAGIPIVGPALGVIASIIALKQGQAQVNEIKATKIPEPALARGGVVGGYGSGTSDSVKAKLSKGEVVINAKSARMFRGALSNMNVAGGGVSFASGGATSLDNGGDITNMINEPLQAFVITDDLTDSQDKLAQIRRRSNI